MNLNRDIYIKINKRGNKEEEGHYMDGNKTGVWTRWCCYSGTKAKGSYKYDNGNKWKEGHYVDGKQTGFWTTWYATGNKEEEGYYKHGTTTGFWS